MPHRPERPTGAAAAGVSGAVYSPHVATANAMRGNLGGRGPILRPAAQPALQHASMYHAAGVVSPIASSAGTVSSNPQSPWMVAQTNGVVRTMPSLQTPKSTDSTDRPTHQAQDEESTVATLATEATTDDARQATASALLMVSTQALKYDKSSVGALPNRASSKDEGEQSSSAVDAQDLGTVPLKKRKKHLDFLRRNQASAESTSDDQPQPFHVSPVSNCSLGSSHVEARTLSTEEGTPGHSSAHSTPSSTAQRTNSYDSKGSPLTQTKPAVTQALPDSAKIHDTIDIAPPAHVVVPHFPTVLHRVLSDKEYAGKVLEWLPNGEAWKVLRWDALRRQVLPVYFSELRDEDGKGSGTIDAFLWHLTAWGFEEVKDGTDVGAYRHDLFIRGAQKLCSKMRFTAVPADDEHAAKTPNAVSPGRVSTGEVGDRTLLQVPSLVSASRSEGEGGASASNTPNKRARYDSPATHGEAPNGTLRRQSSPCPPGWPVRPLESSMIVNYRVEETPYAPTNSWGQYFADGSHHGVRQVGQFSPAGYDPRFHFRHHGAESVMRQPSQYSAPRVRSTRGRLSAANRGVATASAASAASSPPASAASSPAPIRPSFPVSNRGKGSRRPTACRSAVPTADMASVSANSRTQASSEECAKSPTVQSPSNALHSVAVAISRKTKRKQPASSPSQETANSV